MTGPTIPQLVSNVRCNHDHTVVGCQADHNKAPNSANPHRHRGHNNQPIEWYISKYASAILQTEGLDALVNRIVGIRKVGEILGHCFCCEPYIKAYSVVPFGVDNILSSDAKLETVSALPLSVLEWHIIGVNYLEVRIMKPLPLGIG